MPAFTFTSPSGQAYTVNGPDGATPEQAFAILQQQIGGTPKVTAPAFDPNDPRFSESAETGAAGVRGIPILGALANKAGAAVSAAAEPITGVGASGESFSERYAKNLAQEEAAQKAYEAAHPGESLGANVAGGLAVTGPLAGTSMGAKLLGLTGGSLPSMIARSAASGSALNAADAALRGGNPETGAEIGAITGAAGPIAGRLIGAAMRGARNMTMGAGSVPAVPQNVMRVAGVDIPLSTGQATGDQATQMMEQGALRGAEGQAPQRVAEQFFIGQQEPAAEAARVAVGNKLDPFGQVIAQNPQEAAEIASGAIVKSAGAAKQTATNLYNEAFSLPGEFSANAFKGIGQQIKTSLTNSPNPVVIDDMTTPVASRAIQNIDNNISQLRVQNRADPFGPPGPTMQPRTILAGPGYHIADDITEPPNIVGINLAGVDQARKQLVSMAAATQRGTADNRAMGRIIDAFDNRVESAINEGLFSGDPRALDAIKQARSAYRYYRQTFTSQGAGDDVGRAMERITGRNGGDGATPTEVGNYLYGNARVGGSGLSVRLANRMKDVLGDQSPEWSAIRQGLWSRLSSATEGTTEFGPQRQANRIMEFLNGSGAPLAQTMFSSQERALMSRYAMVMQQLTPKPGTVNYSNTAPVLRMIMSNALRGLAVMLGEATAGPAGAAAGFGAPFAAKALAERSAAGRVARSLYQSPAQNASDAQFSQQMARYGALAARSLTGISDQNAANQ